MRPRAQQINWLVTLGTIALTCTVIAGPSFAQHEADGMREAPRALANGPSALPIEPPQALPGASPTAAEMSQTPATQTSPPSEATTLLLGASAIPPGTGADALPAPSGAHGGWGVARTLGALAVVVGLVLVLRAAARWLAVRAPTLGSQLTAGGRAPSGLLEVLGRYPVARGQKLVLLRLDRRVLLLSQTSDGFSTLAELTDPEEVASILTKARDQEGESIAARFTSVMRSMEHDPDLSPAGEVIEIEAPAAHPRSVRLALQQERALAHDTSIVEPKLAPTTGAQALVERLRSMRERWA